MCTTFYCIDIVYIRVDVFGERSVVVQRNFNRNIVFFCLDMDGFVDQFFAGIINVFNKLFKPFFREKSFFFEFAVFINLTAVDKGKVKSRI